MNPDAEQTQKERVSSLENALLKLLVIVFCGAIVGIIFVVLFRLFSSASSHQESLLTPLSQETPTPIPTQAITTTFQQVLSGACTPSKTDKQVYSISIDTLPIRIQQPILTISSTTDKGTFCKGTDVEKYVVLTTNDNRVLYLYDKNLEPFDSFGNSLFHPSPFAQTLDSQSDVTLVMFLKQDQDIVGEVPVIVRGIRPLHLSTGETIFVSTDVEAISGDDPRLIRTLSSFSIPSRQHPGEKELDPTRESEYEAAIKNIFFNGINQIAIPDLNNLIHLQTTLDGISAK